MLAKIKAFVVAHKMEAIAFGVGALFGAIFL